MAISIICTNKDPQPFVLAIRAIAPELNVRVWPDDGDKSDITMVLCWQHPVGVLSDYPNLRLICSLGAGVDHLFADTHLPQEIPVVRLVDDSLATQMREYVLGVITSRVRQFDLLAEQQRADRWQQIAAKSFSAVKVGVMGLGELGSSVAAYLAQVGFEVAGWSRSEKSIAGIECYAGAEQLANFLSHAEVLVNLLPLTPKTTDILNADLFAQLPKDAYVINVGRGGHLVDDDLIAAIDCGQLSGACLDVFRQEPLDKSHRFWSHPLIKVTPHCSSLTAPASVAGQIVENYHCCLAGKKLLNLVDVDRGY